MNIHQQCSPPAGGDCSALTDIHTYVRTHKERQSICCTSQNTETEIQTIQHPTAGFISEWQAAVYFQNV